MSMSLLQTAQSPDRPLVQLRVRPGLRARVLRSLQLPLLPPRPARRGTPPSESPPVEPTPVTPAPVTPTRTPARDPVDQRSPLHLPAAALAVLAVLDLVVGACLVARRDQLAAAGNVVGRFITLGGRPTVAASLCLAGGVGLLVLANLTKGFQEAEPVEAALTLFAAVAGFVGAACAVMVAIVAVAAVVVAFYVVMLLWAIVGDGPGWPWPNRMR